jgi:hypothetical protein
MFMDSLDAFVGNLTTSACSLRVFDSILFGEPSCETSGQARSSTRRQRAHVGFFCRSPIA